MAGTKKKILFRQELFWDVDPKTIDQDKNASYVITRILDFGTDEEIRWMWNYYPHSLIADVVERSRVLFPRTKSLWQILIPKT